VAKADKSMVLIEGLLQSDESIQATLPAYYLPVGANVTLAPRGLLVLTGSRFIFCLSNRLLGQQVSTPLQSVISVELIRGPQSNLKVSTAASTARYVVKYKEAAEFLRKAEKLIAEVRAESFPQAVTSSTDGLVRLADLHTKGLLTDEEFVAAKANALREP